jgi:hypothetical protein
MTKQEAVRQFKDEVLPYIKEKYEQDGKRDVIARSEEWNNFVDWLCQEGDITNWQCENWTHPRCCCW